MTLEEMVQKIKDTPMYSTYYIVEKPSGPRLMMRTYAAVDVEWDHISNLNSNQVEELEKHGVSKWK